MKMYEAFQTDAELETAGVWIDYGDFKICLARAGGANKKFVKLMEQRTRPHRRAIETETFDNDRATLLLQDVYADSVIMAWETKVDDKMVPGIEGPDGKLLPVTKVNMLATFKALPDLFKDLQEQAAKNALFRTQLLLDAAKNS